MMKIANRSLLFILILSLLFLTLGCNFKLSRQTTLPPQLKTIKIKKNDKASQTILRIIKQNLEANGVNVLDNSKNKYTTLLINTENFSTSDIGINASQRMRYYTVNYSITFSLISSNRKIILPPTTVGATQDIILLAQELLTNSNKLEIAKMQLMQKTANKIIYILNSKQVTRMFLLNDKKQNPNRKK